jgi:ferredoxin-NADP reductase
MPAMTTPEIPETDKEAARVVARKSPQRSARVVAAVEVAAGTRHLTLEMLEPTALGFSGGQYVIVDTGLVLPSGKAVKRAYSILSAADDQARIEMATLRLPEGPGSGFMHALAPGAEIRFSGPWGKLHLHSDPLASSGARGALSLALATDTGVTATLGLVRGGWFAPFVADCTFVWLRTATDYFLPEGFVRARLPPGLRAVHIGTLAPLGDPERIAIARRWLREVNEAGGLARAYVAGDGAVNYALLDDLVAAGIPASRDSVESFFNMPKKTAEEGMAT